MVVCKCFVVLLKHEQNQSKRSHSHKGLCLNQFNIVYMYIYINRKMVYCRVYQSIRPNRQTIRNCLLVGPVAVASSAFDVETPIADRTRHRCYCRCCRSDRPVSVARLACPPPFCCSRLPVCQWNSDAPGSFRSVYVRGADQRCIVYYKWTVCVFVQQCCDCTAVRNGR